MIWFLGGDSSKKLCRRRCSGPWFVAVRISEVFWVAFRVSVLARSCWLKVDEDGRSRAWCVHGSLGAYYQVWQDSTAGMLCRLCWGVFPAGVWILVIGVGL
ncbi:hypothetical protein U1Q18_040800 [Sarracenia purpurea var. burkii]